MEDLPGRLRGMVVLSKPHLTLPQQKLIEEAADALERVLALAAELQADEHDTQSYEHAGYYGFRIEKAVKGDG